MLVKFFARPLSEKLEHVTRIEGRRAAAAERLEDINWRIGLLNLDASIGDQPAAEEARSLATDAEKLEREIKGLDAALAAASRRIDADRAVAADVARQAVIDEQAARIEYYLETYAEIERINLQLAPFYAIARRLADEIRMGYYRGGGARLIRDPLELPSRASRAIEFLSERGVSELAYDTPSSSLDRPGVRSLVAAERTAALNYSLAPDRPPTDLLAPKEREDDLEPAFVT